MGNILSTLIILFEVNPEIYLLFGVVMNNNSLMFKPTEKNQNEEGTSLAFGRKTHPAEISYNGEFDANELIFRELNVVDPSVRKQLIMKGELKNIDGSTKCTIGFTKKSKWVIRVLFRILTLNGTLQDIMLVIKERASLFVAFLFGTLMLSIINDISSLIDDDISTSPNVGNSVGNLIGILVFSVGLGVYKVTESSILVCLKKPAQLYKRIRFNKLINSTISLFPSMGGLKDLEWYYNSDDEDPDLAYHIFLENLEFDDIDFSGKNGYFRGYNTRDVWFFKSFSRYFACPTPLGLPDYEKE